MFGNGLYLLGEGFELGLGKEEDPGYILFTEEGWLAGWL